MARKMFDVIDVIEILMYCPAGRFKLARRLAATISLGLT